MYHSYQTSFVHFSFNKNQRIMAGTYSVRTFNVPLLAGQSVLQHTLLSEDVSMPGRKDMFKDESISRFLLSFKKKT